MLRFLNFNNRLVSIGGYSSEHAGKVRRIDVGTDPATSTEIMDLDMGFELSQAVAVGNTLYLYGGYVSELQTLKFSKNTKIYCYTFDGQKGFRDCDKETEVKGGEEYAYKGRMEG